jgi:hypothetical protein
LICRGLCGETSRTGIESLFINIIKITIELAQVVSACTVLSVFESHCEIGKVMSRVECYSIDSAGYKLSLTVFLFPTTDREDDREQSVNVIA